MVAIAASAGGIAALSTVLGGLPGDFPAPVLVVQHLEPHRTSLLATILGGRTPLCVAQAAGGERAGAGTVYLAPPDRHLLLEDDGRLALSDAPPVHFSRPSADPLFLSVARARGRGAIAVVLTGRDSDGSDGVRAVRQAGGTTIAQAPGSAESPAMPTSAIGTGSVDLVLPLDEIASALVTLVTRSHAP